MKTAVIIPAYNEETTIGDILKLVLESVNEVIVVDDGSKDKTAKISEDMGAKVERLEKNEGKGMAMKKGLKKTDAEVVLFLDADLIGFEKEYISKLITPVLKGEFDMCVGVRKYFWGLPRFAIKIDPLFALSGIRSLKREIFEDISLDFVKGFGVETALNYYCKKKGLKVGYFNLGNIKQLTKEEKWGLAKGIFQRIKLIFEIIAIRIKLLFKKEI